MSLFCIRLASFVPFRYYFLSWRWIKCLLVTLLACSILYYITFNMKHRGYKISCVYYTFHWESKFAFSKLLLMNSFCKKHWGFVSFPPRVSHDNGHPSGEYRNSFALKVVLTHLQTVKHRRILQEKICLMVWEYSNLFTST
jgi:hypothetical protein